jgi:energy-coupling factor transporter ATP-binding protein EcfA2
VLACWSWTDSLVASATSSRSTTLCGFVGPNGAGKTTAMRIVLGVLSPTPARCAGTAAQSTPRPARFGYMPEERGLYIPPVAPMTMPPRIALGEASAVEVVGALAVTLGATALLVPLAARIYSGSVLRTGGTIKLREAWRAARA